MYFDLDEQKYFGVDYNADEEEYWRNNNDYKADEDADEKGE